MLVKMPEKTTCIPARKRASAQTAFAIWKGGVDARPHEAASGHQQDPGEGVRDLEEVAGVIRVPMTI
ncbi:MAG TPA: hypothetical protein PK196_07995 [Methanoculleus sp.]|jgi:hypothetical protein|nr:hypothetical protein [Methanoculleus sp.]HON41393.1 hypothetical protein [Methanoculleus sp.]